MRPELISSGKTAPLHYAVCIGIASMRPELISSGKTLNFQLPSGRLIALQ